MTSDGNKPGKSGMQRRIPGAAGSSVVEFSPQRLRTVSGPSAAMHTAYQPRLDAASFAAEESTRSQLSQSVLSIR